MKDVYVIEGHDFAEWSGRHARGSVPGRYPYSIEHLESHGYRLTFTEHRHLPRPGGIGRRLLDAVEYRTGYPIGEPLLGLRKLRSSDICISLFEDHSVVAARLRSWGVLGRPGPKLVVIACWLAEHAISGSPRTRVVYARRMARVDLVVCFSGNQRDILWQRLGIPKERIVVVPFGAETDFFCPDQVVEGGYVFAAGGDRGRDYLTLAAAVSDRPIPLQVVGWRFTTERINWGPAVEVTGVIDHLDYRRRLASSSVVVVPSYPLAYPSGQSVLVEAMAMGKACVATESPPLRDYIDHGRNGLLVPPGDPEALRRAMQKLLADRQLRRDLGREASMDVVKRFNRESMWSKIALAMKDL